MQLASRGSISDLFGPSGPPPCRCLHQRSGRSCDPLLPQLLGRPSAGTSHPGSSRAPVRLLRRWHPSQNSTPKLRGILGVACFATWSSLPKILTAPTWTLSLDAWGKGGKGGERRRPTGPSAGASNLFLLGARRQVQTGGRRGPWTSHSRRVSTANDEGWTLPMMPRGA